MTVPFRSSQALTDSTRLTLPSTLHFTSFVGAAKAHPFIGQAGVLERVPEMRLETVVPRAALGRVLPALLASHPYEEVAYDLLPLENSWPGAGLGPYRHSGDAHYCRYIP